MTNVVLHCQSDIAAENYAHLLAGKVEGIAVQRFSGNLEGETLDSFLNACVNAQVILVDPICDGMFDVLQKTWEANPEAAIMAQLIDGTYETEIHRIAMPFSHYSDDPRVIEAILDPAKSVKRGGLILIVDDNEYNRKSAADGLIGRRIMIEKSYLQALKTIDKYSDKIDIVMTDMMMPGERKMMGSAGNKFVGQEEPMGIFVALKAYEVGIREIHVVSDTGHHDHPAAHAVEYLAGDGKLHWDCEMYCPKVKVGEKYVKDWAQALNPQHHDKVRKTLGWNDLSH